jgi:hypothetical protein
VASVAGECWQEAQHSLAANTACMAAYHGLPGSCALHLAAALQHTC